MKRAALLLTLVFVFQGIFFASAQKIGVVDTDYLLNNIPEYKEANTRFETQIKHWQAQLDTLQSNYQNKKELLENERILLVGEQLKTREKEVEELEKKVKTHLKEKFTAEGEINKFRSNMVKPFQDKIWAAIKVVAEKNGLGIILDKNSNSSVLFLDKFYDYTEKVLAVLRTKKEEKEEKKENSQKKKK